MKTLILYYSQARGNTKQIAQMIQERLHAEMEQIQTRVPYTGSYDAIVNQGKREVDSAQNHSDIPGKRRFFRKADYSVCHIRRKRLWQNSF